MAKKKARVKVFDSLRESLQDAPAFERSESVDLRVIEVPPRPERFRPRQIREIRRALNASQALFATYLNASTSTVRSLGARHAEAP